MSGDRVYDYKHTIINFQEWFVHFLHLEKVSPKTYTSVKRKIEITEEKRVYGKQICKFANGDGVQDVRSSHLAGLTHDKLIKLEWETLPYILYSIHLSLCYTYLNPKATII